MCGIVGIVNYKKDISNNYAILRNMNSTLKKRGPNEERMFFDKSVNLAHQRLTVIDPECGKQPMHFMHEGTTYTIICNGQIYNAQELKKILIENGFTFKTRSDIEVLLKAYVHYKEDVLNYLIGVFAFAIWNNKTKELFLARDHFGIKPLYFTFKNDNFIFASEIKAIIEHPEVEPTLDEQGICELFGLGPSHSPRKLSI